MTELQKMISQCLNNGCWYRLASYLPQLRFKIVIYKEISHGINQICSGHNFLVIPVPPWFPDGCVWYGTVHLVTTTCVYISKIKGLLYHTLCCLRSLENAWSFLSISVNWFKIASSYIKRFQDNLCKLGTSAKPTWHSSPRYRFGNTCNIQTHAIVMYTLPQNNKFYDRHIDLLKTLQSFGRDMKFSEGWDRFFEVIRKTWRCLHSSHTCTALHSNYMITIPTTCNHSIPCKNLEGAQIYKFLTTFPSHLQAITYLCTICEDHIFNEIETFNPLSNEVKMK